MIGWIILAVVMVLILIVAIWMIAGYNGLVKKRNDVEEGFSTMDVYMKKRYDLIPNLVETVKGYAKHEKETLTSVIAARNMALGANSIEERAEGETFLTNTLKSIFSVAENYPELKADKNFTDLQNQLKTLEVEISNSRKYYNAVVKKYNNAIEVFPTNILAGMFKFKRKTMFEIVNKEERENVKVSFD